MIRVIHVDRSTLNFLNRAQGKFHVIKLQRFSHQAMHATRLRTHFVSRKQHQSKAAMHLYKRRDSGWGSTSI